MPVLLEDLAEETLTSNQRTADRLDVEIRELEALQRQLAALKERSERIVESARQATELVISRLPQAEAVWRLALIALRKEPTGDAAERLLRRLLSMFESGQRLVQSPRALWKIVEQSGAAPERIDELERVERRFEELAAEARLALEHRARDWQPADPERLAAGLQMTREGRTVSAADAQARFRTSRQ